MDMESAVPRSQVVVGNSGNVEEGGRIVVSVDGEEVGIFRVDGVLYAWSNYCVHAGGPICQGLIINRVEERLTDDKRSLGDYFAEQRHIVCPWHGYEYDITTGEHPADPRLRLRSFPVFEREGEIVVEL
jgi:nitrite reductase/ring-hydroxylating ferredoxin subunit